MTVKCCSLGIILDDIVFPDGRTQMGMLGGGGAQSTWGMALAAESGHQAGLVAGIGPDFPEGALAPLEAMEADLSGVHTTDLPTPRAWQLLEADGRRTHVWRVNQSTSDRQTHPDAETILHYYPELRLVQWGIHPEEPYLQPCESLRQRGITVSIEPFKGLDAPYSDAILEVILSQADIFSPNWQEAVSLFGVEDRSTLLARAKALGGHILALRKGAAGSEVWDLRLGEGMSVPAAPARQIVDPVGAGDAYCGAFSLKWVETRDLGTAAAWGAVAASFMLEQVGMPLQRPSAAEVATRYNAVTTDLKRLSTRHQGMPPAL
ncbi:MAG: carbohydrate kinase family protein [Anaerolineae bacterium]|nr:carbohydrate kinase family protein [Anaerolineae bacterium]